MFLVPINYLAVILCGISYMVIGMLWFGPLFGKRWMRLSGITEKKLKELQQNGMTQTYAISFVSSLVMAYVLDHFIWFTAPGAVTIAVGIKTAIWAWLGFVATTSLAGYLYTAEKKPMSLYLLDNGCWFVSFLFFGIILSVWR